MYGSMPTKTWPPGPALVIRPRVRDKTANLDRLLYRNLRWKFPVLRASREKRQCPSKSVGPGGQYWPPGRGIQAPWKIIAKNFLQGATRAPLGAPAGARCSWARCPARGPYANMVYQWREVREALNTTSKIWDNLRKMSFSEDWSSL